MRLAKKKAASAVNDALSIAPPAAVPAAEMLIPGVYRDRGFLVLALERKTPKRGKKYKTAPVQIELVRGNTGELEYVVESQLGASYTPLPQCSAALLALNLLGRAAARIVSFRVRVLRRLCEMVTASKDELLALSERALAREYNRIVKPKQELTRISGAARAERVDEILAAAASMTERQADAETTSQETGVLGDESQSTPETTLTKEHDMAAKKAAKAPAAKTEAKKKGRTRDTSPIKAVAAAVKNPYREGSKKAAAFDVFRKGGEREEITKAIVKLGATQNTANSWLHLFVRYAGSTAAAAR